MLAALARTSRKARSWTVGLRSVGWPAPGWTAAPPPPPPGRGRRRADQGRRPGRENHAGGGDDEAVADTGRGAAPASSPRWSPGLPGRRPPRSRCCPALWPGPAGPTARSWSDRRPRTPARRSMTRARSASVCEQPGEPDVVADRESDGRPVHVDDERLRRPARRCWTRRTRRRRTGGSCRSWRPRPARDPQRVADPAVVGRGEHAGHRSPVVFDGDRRQPRRPGPVDRLGDLAPAAARSSASSPREDQQVGTCCAGPSRRSATRSRLAAGSALPTICTVQSEASPTRAGRRS